MAAPHAVTESRPAVRAALGVTVAVALAVVAVLALRSRLPSPAEVWHTLSAANGWWVLAAFLAEVVSLGMFARQQRRLLQAFGVRITLPRAGAITYSRTAIAIALPAGSAISAGFAFRQFRASGASRATAATVMVLSGVVSFAALLLLYLTGLLAAAAAPVVALVRTQPEASVLIGLVAVLGVVAVVGTRPPVDDDAPIRHRASHVLAPHWPWWDSAVAQIGQVVQQARSVPPRHWSLALAAAVVNWSADLGCLFAAAMAFELPVGIMELGAVYLGVQVVRQIPLTPGGVGLIEASLLAGLVSAGGGYREAAATIIVYRLLSCWLVLPIGAVAWAVLRRQTPTPSDDDGAVALEASPGSAAFRR